MIDLKTLPEEGWRQRDHYDRLELADGSAVEKIVYELFCCLPRTMSILI